MPLVKAKEDCWTSEGEYVAAGTQFDYKGPQHDSLVPVKKSRASVDDENPDNPASA